MKPLKPEDDDDEVVVEKTDLSSSSSSSPQQKSSAASASEPGFDQEPEPERDMWGDVIKKQFDCEEELRKIYWEASTLPNFNLNIRQQLLHSLPWHKRSREAALKQKFGGKHIVGNFFPRKGASKINKIQYIKDYDNNISGLQADLDEAIARQQVLVYGDEEFEIGLKHVPKAIRLLTTVLMQYSRFNPIAVAASLVGVGKSCWPGREYSKDWDDALERLYSRGNDGNSDDDDDNGNYDDVDASPKKHANALSDALHDGNTNANHDEMRHLQFENADDEVRRVTKIESSRAKCDIQSIIEADHPRAPYHYSPCCSFPFLYSPFSVNK